MHRIRAEVVDDRGKIVDAVLDGEIALQIEGGGRLPQPARIGAHHLEPAREIRHPAIPEFAAAAEAVLQEQIGRVFPRVGVVIQRVMQVRLAGAFDEGHRVYP